MRSQRSSWLVFSVSCLCFRKNEEIFNFCLQWVICAWDNMYIGSSNLGKRVACLKNNVRKTIMTAKIKWIDFVVWVSHELSAFGAEENFRGTSLFMVSPSREKHKKNIAISLCLPVSFTKLWHVLHCIACLDCGSQLEAWWIPLCCSQLPFLGFVFSGEKNFPW